MPKARLSAKQKRILAQLEDLARRTGHKISYGDLKFAGLRLKAGQCLFKGQPWIVMDRRQPFDDQVDVFREALADLNVGGMELEPETRKALGWKTDQPPLGDRDERGD
jgi:hypothetical protein